MYATNDNPQAVESRRKIRDALLALMARYPYHLITVTQICQEAQIVRQTYYRNFGQKDDILKFHLDGMVGRYFSDYFMDETVRAQLTAFFGFMLLNRDFLVLASKNGFFFMIEDVITQNIAGFLNLEQIADLEEPMFENYATRFIAAAICSLLSLWTANGFVESPGTMSLLAQKFLSGIRSDGPTGRPMDKSGRSC